MREYLDYCWTTAQTMLCHARSVSGGRLELEP